MRDDNERIKYAQWVLERTLTFIGAAEVKVGAIIAMNLAMLGGLGGIFLPLGNTVSGFPLLFLTFALICLSASLLCCALLLLPNMEGPERSYIFFGRIGKSPQRTYFTDFSQAGEEAILKDLLAQIHTNSKIACSKYERIRLSMIWSFLSITPWFLSFVTLIYQ